MSTPLSPDSLNSSPLTQVAPSRPNTLALTVPIVAEPATGFPFPTHTPPTPQTVAAHAASSASSPTSSTPTPTGAPAAAASSAATRSAPTAAKPRRPRRRRRRKKKKIDPFIVDDDDDLESMGEDAWVPESDRPRPAPANVVKLSVAKTTGSKRGRRKKGAGGGGRRLKRRRVSERSGAVSDGVLGGGVVGDVDDGDGDGDGDGLGEGMDDLRLDTDAGRRRRRGGRGGGGGGGGRSAGGVNSGAVPASAVPTGFDAIEQEVKRDQPRRRDDTDGAEVLASAASLDLLRALASARELDKRSMDQGQIPVHKLVLLPRLKKEASKMNLQLALLEDNLLGELANWLKPYQGTLPALQIRETIIDLLLSFPCQSDKEIQLYPVDGTFEGITTSKLERSRIGQVVHFLSKHESETQENRRKCKLLIEKWSRVIHDMNIDNYDEAVRSRSVKRMKTEVKYTAKRDLEPGDVGFIPRATIPNVVGYDFVKHPGGRDAQEMFLRPADRDQYQSSMQQRMHRKINQMRRRKR